MIARDARADVYQALNEILMRPKKKIVEEFGDYFFEYFRGMIFENPNANNGDVLGGYFSFQQNLFELAQARNKRVLEVGCGFGLTSICFYILGAKEVVGIDIDHNKIANFNKLVSFLKIEKEVRGELADACMQSSDARVFDAVTCNEVISHVRDLDGFLDSTLRLLVPGGRIVIRDGNNALNKAIVIDQQRIQHKSEYGPVDGTGLEKPYRQMRYDMIRDRFPQLEHSVAQRLAENTKGLWGEQISEVVEKYFRTGNLNQVVEYQFRNPLTGEYQERLFDPLELAGRLRAIGFRSVRVHPIMPFGYSKIGRKAALKLIEPLNPLFFRIWKIGFEIEAAKI